MIWAAFSHNGKIQIMLLKGYQKFEDYIKNVKNHLLPNEENLFGENWIFQQDNDSIHIRNYSKKKWFSDQNINLFDAFKKFRLKPSRKLLENLGQKGLQQLKNISFRSANKS